MPAYKDEKRGTWYVRFRYTDWTGKRIETTKRGFATKREAKEYEESARKEKTAAAGMTFGQLYGIYAEDMRLRLRETTMQTKENIHRMHTLPYFSALRLEQITPAAVRKWQGEIIGKGLSPTFQKTIQNCLSAVLNYAVKYYGLPQNPIPIAGSIGKVQAGEMDYWTLGEFRRFIACEDKPMYRAAFLTLFWCGLRCGELLALTGQDIDMGARTIRIDKTYTRLSGKKDSITPPKTPGSTRTIAAPSVVLGAIKEHIGRVYGYEEKARLFPIHPKTLRGRMHKLSNIAGVKKYASTTFATRTPAIS